jgi:hypothetical protein
MLPKLHCIALESLQYFGRMKLIALIIFFSFTNGVSSSFNETFAKYFLWPMAASAYSDHPELCVNDNFKQSDFKRRIQVRCDILKEDTCAAFSAVSHSDKAIIISFRGSEDAEITMEVVDAITVLPISEFSGKAKVNQYFYDAFNDIWNAGLKNDFLSLKNANPGYEVWITGHSLGAAMASLAATTLVTTKVFPADKIKLVTFGQPRVGDKTYAALIDSLMPYAYRVIHHRDLVSNIPPQFLYGYHHHKSEVWYNNDMTKGQPYLECDEDESKKCSDSKLDLSTADHSLYYNVATSFATNGCKGWNPFTI